MTGAEASVLQYGALGLLGIVLVAVAVYLRETSRRTDERLSKRDEFMQALFGRVTAQLDATAIAQQQTAIALGELCKAVNGHCAKADEDHAKLLVECARQRSSSSTRSKAS